MKVSAINAILTSKLSSVISEPQAAELMVTNVFFLATTGRFIINYRAMTAYNVGVLQSLIAPFESVLTGDEEAEIDLDHDDAKGLRDALNIGVSSSARATDYVPAKGEIVKVQFGWVPMKDGSGDALLVTNVSEVKAKSTGRVAISSLFAKKEAPAVIGQTPKVEESETANA